jgi:hypothetical protein
VVYEPSGPISICDSISNRNTAHIASNGLDNTGRLVPQDRRERRRRKRSAAEIDLDEVETDRLVANADLSLPSTGSTASTSGPRTGVCVLRAPYFIDLPASY